MICSPRNIFSVKSQVRKNLVSLFPNLCKTWVSFSFLSTLVCRMDVQGKINVQVEKFLKNNKRAGQNRRAGGIFVFKILIKVQDFEYKKQKLLLLHEKN